MKIAKYFTFYHTDMLLGRNHDVEGITDNSKEVRNNFVFVAITGYHHKGVDYIAEAIKNGAKTIFYDEDIDISNSNVNMVKVLSAKVELARLLRWYYRKNKKPKIIAVTGTNGKTSVTTYTFWLLKSLHINCLLIGTEENISYFNGRLRYIKTSNTTPALTTIYKLMGEFPYDYLVMEASSQGIEESRVLGLSFDVVCFTNITEDHLDYHKTMDNYANAKSRLIYQLKDCGTLILNQDMAYFEQLQKLTLHQIYTYSSTSDKAFIYGKILERKLGKMKVEINCRNEKHNFYTKILGDFNLDNLLATYAIIKALKIKTINLDSYFTMLKVVKGRMNLFLLNHIFVVIDFAHTPDGILKVLSYFKMVKKAKLISVLGCGGNRDPQKRPIMAKIATNYSDMVIFTEDNSRDEKLENIISDMIKGVEGKNYLIEKDRKHAIDKALDFATTDDIVCILGKGSENAIIERKIKYFSDLEYIVNLGGKRLNG